MNDFIPDIDICLKSEEEQIDYKEYVLAKDKVKYTIKIGKTKSKIIIDCIHYEYKSNLDELIQISKLFNICKTIEEVYEFIINLFNKKKVSIKEIFRKIKDLYYSLKYSHKYFLKTGKELRKYFIKIL